MKLFIVIILTVTGISVACAGYKSASSPSVANDAASTAQASNPPINLTAQEKSACNLDMSQAAVISGLKLGLTRDEVLALFPGSKDDAELRARLAEPSSEFGVSNFVITPSKYETREKFVEISQITLTLLDGRVSSFSVGYNGPEWPHVDKFVAKFVEGTSLPSVDQWEPYVGMENLKILKCTDFEVRVFAGGAGGNLNYVLLQDVQAAKTLKERRAKARAAATPSPEEQ